MGAAAQQQPAAPMESSAGDLRGSRSPGTALPAPGVTPAPVGATHRWFHPDPPCARGQLREHRQQEQHRIHPGLPSRRLTGQGLAMLTEANKPYRRVTSSSFVAICFSQQRTNTSSRYSLYNRAEQGWETARLRTGAAPAKLARARTLL